MSEETKEIYEVPSVAMKETPEGWTFTFEIPGISKENAELSVEGRTLTLKTKSKYEKPAGFKCVACEFERNNYAVSVDLPERAEPATLSAALENGILAVTIAKKPETCARKITIG